MLKVEDCKPGIEVIAIKQIWRNPKKPLLSIGCIYTIDKLYDQTKVSGKIIYEYNISLSEVPITHHSKGPWLYSLGSFKLRDPEELYTLFDIKKNSILEPV